MATPKDSDLGEYSVVHGGGTRSRYVGEKGAGRHVVLKNGTTVHLTAAEAKALGKDVRKASTQPKADFPPADLDDMPGQYAPSVAATIAPTTGQTGGSKSASSDSSESTDWAEVSDGGTAEDLKKMIAGMDNADEIKALRTAEKKGKGRVSVIEAAEARLGEL